MTSQEIKKARKIKDKTPLKNKDKGSRKRRYSSSLDESDNDSDRDLSEDSL